jgi:hypothetical protein
MRYTLRILLALAMDLMNGTIGFPVNSVRAADGCSEQLFREFLAGWSHEMLKLMATLADVVSRVRCPAYNDVGLDRKKNRAGCYCIIADANGDQAY